MNYEISVNGEPPNIYELKTLFKKCKWDWLEPDSEMQQAIDGSFLRITAEHNGGYIGFARVISDGKICALLIDCMVDPQFRNRGIGKILVARAVSECRKAGLKVIQLLASAEGLRLYKNAGFTVCSPASPGMVKFLANE